MLYLPVIKLYIIIYIVVIVVVIINIITIITVIIILMINILQFPGKEIEEEEGFFVQLLAPNNQSGKATVR